MSWWLVVSSSLKEPGLHQPGSAADAIDPADDTEDFSAAQHAPACPPHGLWFSWWEASRAGVVSAIFHAVALIVLGLNLVSPEEKSPDLAIIAQQASPLAENGVQALDESFDATPLQVDVQFSSALMAGDPNQPLEYDLTPASAVQSLSDGRQAEMLAALMAEDGDGGSGDNSGGGLGGLAGLGDTAGAGPANANGGKSASFFGVKATGQQFVFVVDMSSSMEGHRFQVAKRELRRSLAKLAKNQSFFVVFFNTEAFPMPAGDLVPASRENLTKAQQWIDDFQCGGSTDPRAALTLAVELDPDVIFFMTDGEFDPAIVEMIEPASTSDGVKIHTIAFQSRSGENLMQAIAKRTRGTYRFVK